MKVRRITKEEGKRVNISRFPNFHKSGSIKGMKNSITALPRCWCVVEAIYIT